MLRYDIINALINKYHYGSYLEIGVQQGVSFEKVRCARKVGVDPDPRSKATYKMASDAFFEQNKERFDIVFIDGLHHADQVYRDFKNSLNMLNPGGAIVFHDCLPENEQMQRIPISVSVWTGDTYKAFIQCRSEHRDMLSFVVDTDWGCGVFLPGIKPGRTQVMKHELKIGDIGYEQWLAHRAEWMNIIPVAAFRELLAEKETTVEE